MKKLLAAMLAIFMLAACGTKETSENPTAGTPENPVQDRPVEAQEKIITLYESDAQAEQTVPFEESFKGNEEEMVPFIFAKVNRHDVELLDYKFKNGDTRLILDLGDEIYSIQGSAGSSMFVETLARSYFENFPQLEEVLFLYKGSYESILDHMMIGEPYTRQDFNR